MAYAFRLARILHAGLYVVHVVPEDGVQILMALSAQAYIYAGYGESDENRGHR